MQYEDFLLKLRGVCRGFGFSPSRIQGWPAVAGGVLPATSLRGSGEGEAVICLSCRVPYNPNWGGYCGHPQQLVKTEPGEEGRDPAAFIGPFLHQYRCAAERVLLTAAPSSGKMFINLPENLVEEGKERPQLLLRLGKVARPDETGRIVPVSASGSRRVYQLAESFCQLLEERGFAWNGMRAVPIGRHLASDLFTFLHDGAGNPDSPFAATLLPHLSEIVAHPTPHLRAAELHLGQVFARTAAALSAGGRRQHVLCLAGLDIDMSTLWGHQEHAFVPWKAFLAQQGDVHYLEQDDLFVRLMREDGRG